jgi:hypothetical protein
MSALPSLVDYKEPMVILPEDSTNYQVVCTPTGSGTFGPSSQIVVDLQNVGFLDPASLMIRYKMTYKTAANTDAVSICGTPAYTPILRHDVIVNSVNVESINNYNSLCNMLTNIKLSVADKYGQQQALGYENQKYLDPGVSPAVATSPASMEVLDGALLNLNTVATATTYVRTYSAPLYNLLSGSEKLVPLFLTNAIRLQFTLDTVANIQGKGAGATTGASALATDGTGFSISNFEVVYNAVSFGSAVEREIIAMNPKLRIKTQSYATGNQTVSSGVQGTQSLVYNLRYASVKSAYLICGGTSASLSANGLMDSFDITSNNGDYCLQIGSQQYPQRPLSTTNNKSGILQELRRAMDTIFGNSNSMSISGAEFAFISAGTCLPYATTAVTGYNGATSTQVAIPAKFYVGFNLSRITSRAPMKLFFNGVSTSAQPITATINIGTATSQAHNVMLVANYDAIMEIDTSTKQVVLIS